MNALIDTLSEALRDEARIKMIGLKHELETAVGRVDATSLKPESTFLVLNKEVAFSLYENDIHVIVRSEAGAAVQFGSALFIGENDDGYILDHELLKERSRGDVKGQG